MPKRIRGRLGTADVDVDDERVDDVDERVDDVDSDASREIRSSPALARFRSRPPESTVPTRSRSPRKSARPRTVAVP